MTGAGSESDEVAQVIQQQHDLRSENARLNEQVKALITAEAKLHSIQNNLDHQLNIFGKLHELGVRITRALNNEEIIAELVRFTLYELGFERALVFLDHPPSGKFSLFGFDGYYGDAWAERLRTFSIDSEHPLSRALREERKVIVSEHAARPELGPFAAELDLGELIAFPLFRTETELLGILVAGNSAANRDHYVSVDDPNSQSGFANLSAQATSAIQSAVSHAALQEERNHLEQKVTARTSELADALAGLKELDNAKSQFFANVSHELRTPLTLSIAPLEEILKKGDSIEVPARDRHLKVIYSNQLRLLKLINSLLDVAKLDAKKMTAKFQEMNLVEAVRFYLGTLASATETRRIKLTLESELDEVRLYLDRDMLEKIVMNLLSNAFKFTPDGGRITVQIRSREQEVDLQVSDSGIGISKEAIPKLFQRFTQLDASEKRKYEGTGIGLAMVKEFVALQGGEIRVESDVGVGTTFSITFKKGTGHIAPEAIVSAPETGIRAVSNYQLADLRTDTDEADEEEEGEYDGPAVAASGARDAAEESSAEMAPVETDGATVLVVDDVPDMRNFISHILAEKYRVRRARDGMEGFEMAKRLQPDLIVSDVMMPRMTGYELCTAIRGSAGVLSRTPIILLSAKGELEVKLAGLEHGADDYLVKPFNAEELLSRARNLLRLRQQERRIAAAERRVLEAERKALETEIGFAREVQAKILPTESSYHDQRRSLEGLLVSASACSGDFWMYRVLQDGRLFVCLGDVTGHGAGSAMLTELVYGALRAILLTCEKASLGEILTSLNSIIDFETSVWMTMVACLVDSQARTFEWSNAGHPPILYAEDGKAPLYLGTGAGPIGQHPGRVIESRRIPIANMARILMYSDGLIEAENPNGRPFNLKRLAASFLKNAMDPRQSLETLHNEVVAFCGRDGFDDDITAVALALSPNHDA